MKKYLLLLLTIFALNGCEEDTTIIDATADKKMPKVDVCHYDADTDTWETLHINGNALKAHLKHGDYQGECNLFVDPRDGNEYPYVQIGDQIWMTENLRATKLNNGKAIPLITDNNDWTELTTPGYCWYNNELENKNLYGALYNYYTIETGELAPEGWHIPTADDWLILTNYLGGLSEAGGKMKETGTMNWEEPNTGATNESGFTALPGGFRSQSTGVFYWIKKRGEWWEIGGSNFPNETSLIFLEYDKSGIGRGYPMPYDAAKKRGVYVRCIKD